METFLQQMQTFLPSLLGAFAILIGGWLLAMIIASVVKGVLSRTKLDNKLAQLLGESPSQKTVDIEGLAGSLIFYLIMAFVLVAFFQALGLTLITEPLNTLLGEVFKFAPRILMGGGLLLLAWIVATIVRSIVGKVMTTARVDQRLGEKAGQGVSSSVSLTKTVSETLYWLIFLLFLPAVLNAFALQGVLGPINAMVGQIVGFVPNLLSAAMILGIGWFVARIVQQVISNLLAAAGADQLAEKFNLSNLFGSQKLSAVVGLVAYVFILVPVLISALNTLAIESISRPATNMLNIVMAAIPLIFAAVVVLFVAFTIGKVVASLVSNVLAGIGFNNVLAKLGLNSSPANADAKTPSQIMGTLCHAAIVLFGVTEAFNLLGFASLNAFVSEIIVLGGHVLMGVAIFAAGLFAANWIAGMIRSSGSAQANLLSTTARVAILFLTGSMALRQMGLANEIINLAFGILLGAAGVAIAIAFGMGGREIAARELDGWTKSLKSGDSTRNRETANV